MRKTACSAVHIVLGALLSLAGLLPSAAQAGLADAQPLLGLDTGGHMAMIRTVLIMPDRRQIVTAGDDRTIRFWDIQTGRTQRILRGEINEGSAGKVYALAISRDGRWLAAGGRFVEPRAGAHPIRLYDLQTGEIVALLHGHKGPVFSLAFSADGRTLASGSADKTAILWDVEKRTKLRQLSGHTRDINRVAFTLDGERLATSADDGFVMLWRVKDGRLLAKSPQLGGEVLGLAVNPVTGEVAAATHKGEIAILDDLTARPVNRFSSKGTEFRHVVYSPDGRTLLAGTGNEPFHCIVFDVERGTPVQIYRGHQHIVMAAAISSDGRLAVTAGGWNNEIHIWEYESGRLLRSMQGTGAGVVSVGFSADGSEVAFGQTNDFRTIHERGSLEYILPVAGEKVRMREPRRDPARAKTFLRARTEVDGTSLSRKVAGKFGYAANLEIARKGARTAVISRDENSGFLHNSFTFGAGGKTVISGGGNGSLTEYDLRGKLRAPEFKGHFGDVWAVAVSPDGKLLASGGDDQTLRIWNIATRELVLSVFYGTDREWVMWTPQGYYVSSPGGDALVGWHINRGPDKAADFVTARQLRWHFYRPDIVDEAIRRASAEEAVKAAGAANFSLADLNTRLPPDLLVLSERVMPNAGHAVVTVAVAEDPSALVESFTITVGGRRVPAKLVEPDRTRAARPLERGFANSRRAGFQIPLAEGTNNVRISARNAVGESQPVDFAIELLGEGALDTRGTLYLIAIGVDQYFKAGDVLPNLEYAGADAKAFEAEVGRRLGVQHEKVERHLLVTGAGGELEPSQSNITAALSVLRKATENDTVVVFLAGHGDNEGSDYLFIPADGKLADRSTWDRSSVVPWTTLLHALSEASGRRLLFVDTCHSANAFNFRLLKDTNDADIIAYSATNKEQNAAELPKLKHGVFTYALLEALAGAADRNGDKVIRVFELASYLNERVEELTLGAQSPDFYRKVGSRNLVLVRL
jgi:WD40 repeat protein